MHHFMVLEDIFIIYAQEFAIQVCVFGFYKKTTCLEETFINISFIASLQIDLPHACKYHH
jgi:hypothetical protein